MKITSQPILGATRLFMAPLLGFLIITVPVSTPAGVVINEIMANPTDRGLDWSRGYPVYGSGVPWTSPDFDDSSWPQGAGPLGFGYTGLGTTLNLQSITPSLYLRKTFAVSSSDAIRPDPVQILVDFDDGVVVYLNGQEVARKSMGGVHGYVYHDQPAYNQHNAGSQVIFYPGAASSVLKAGTNVLAVQVHNVNVGDGDLKISVGMQIAGTPFSTLFTKTETFRYFPGLTEPSGGLSEPQEIPTDWRLRWIRLGFDDTGWPKGPGGFGYADGDDATVLNLSGKASTVYIRRVFEVTPDILASSGPLQLVADYDDGFIAYLNGKVVARRNAGTTETFFAYNATATGDHEAGTPATINLGLPSSFLVEGENVLAVQAFNNSPNGSDLSIIVDLKIGGTTNQMLVRHGDIWRYCNGLREPAGEQAPLDDEFSDWIELYNNGTESVSLAGWSLTDDEDQPGQWDFPDVSIPAGGFLVVLATGNQNVPAGNHYLHANFELSSEGEYIGLYNNGHPRQVVDRIYPGYPPQDQVHSYGRSGSEGKFCYLEFATPGAPNIAGATFAGILPKPVLSAPHGIYPASFELTMTCSTAGALIRYTTNGSEPTGTIGADYEKPLPITHNAVIRARCFKEGYIPSEIVTQSYLMNLIDGQDTEIANRDFIVMIGYTGEAPTTLIGPMTSPYPTQMVAGTALGQTFVAPKPFTRIGSSNPTWYTTNANFKLTLYDGIGGNAIASRVITNAVDNATNYLTFPEQPAGSYYLEMSDLTGGGQVGWWGEPADIYPYGEPHIRYIPTTDGYAALKSIPAISIVGDSGGSIYKPHGVLAIVGGSYSSGKWMPTTIDDYNHVIVHGRCYERPVSVEFIPPDGQPGFQANCGIRPGRSDVWRPGLQLTEGVWLGVGNKFTFRFYFRGDYGLDELDYPLFPDTSVDQYKILAIRSGNDTDYNNPFVKESFLFRTLAACGQVSPHCRNINLFINGEFKNYYSVTDRVDVPFLQQHYKSDKDWDVIRSQVNLTFTPQFELANGDYAAWDDLWVFLNGRSMANYDNYLEATRRVDVVNFVDYLLVNLWSVNQDWPWNNWITARERSDSGKFRFYLWDADIAFINGTVSNNHVSKLENESNTIPILYRALKASPEFQLLFADRVQALFYNNGPMAQANLQSRFQALRNEVELMIGAVYSEPFDTYIPNTWIPQRQGYLLTHLRSVGLWPSLMAPAFNQHGGEVSEGFQVTIQNPNGATGAILYTTDGTDPRVPNSGGTSASAHSYSLPITIEQTTVVKARVKNGNTWSPIVEAEFKVNKNVSPGEVLITEFMANVAGDDEFKEWFEVYNTTDNPIDLRDWIIADNGTDSHVITGNTPVLVPAKGYLVLGESSDTGINGNVSVGYAYGQDITLGNNGDEIVLVKDGVVIHSIGYGTYDVGTYPILTQVGQIPTSGAALGMAADYCANPTTLWKNQTTVYNTANDRGTPGQPNNDVQVCSSDVFPPYLVSAKFARGDLALLEFNEPLDSLSAEVESNYLISGSGGPATATLVAENKILLNFTDRLDPGVSHVLTIQGIRDVHQNALSSPLYPVFFYEEPVVSINEIMYNDRNSADIEWIELHNTTDQEVDISGWYLTDDDVYPAEGEGSVIIPQGTILTPHEYAILNLWNSPSFSLWQFPPSIRVITPVVLEVGALSNSGDNLSLYSAASAGSMVDGSLVSAYPNLSSEGRSIEKIDEAFPWGDIDTISYNFRAAVIPIGFPTGLADDGFPLSSFASPGRENGTPYGTSVEWWSQY